MTQYLMMSIVHQLSPLSMNLQYLPKISHKFLIFRCLLMCDICVINYNIYLGCPIIINVFETLLHAAFDERIRYFCLVWYFRNMKKAICVVISHIHRICCRKVLNFLVIRQYFLI